MRENLRLAVQAEGSRGLLQAPDDVADVLVQLDAELRRAPINLLPVHAPGRLWFMCIPMRTN